MLGIPIKFDILQASSNHLFLFTLQHHKKKKGESEEQKVTQESPVIVIEQNDVDLMHGMDDEEETHAAAVTNGEVEQDTKASQPANTSQNNIDEAAKVHEFETVLKTF